MDQIVIKAMLQQNTSLAPKGHLTIMSDVYSLGVVLLGLLTSKRSMDKTGPRKEHSLVEWARRFLKDPRKVDLIMDPKLEGQYSSQGARVAAALAYQCLKSRLKMSTVVKTLEPLQQMTDIPRHCVCCTKGR